MVILQPAFDYSRRVPQTIEKMEGAIRVDIDKMSGISLQRDTCKELPLETNRAD